MNERIRELAKEARLLTGWTVGEVEYQKFAELIVQECINTVQTFRTKMDASTDNIVVALKERFGDKE